MKLKLTVLIIVLMMLLSCTAFVIMLVSFKEYGSNNLKNVELLCRIFEKIDSYTQISTLTRFSQLNFPQNETQLLLKQVEITNNLSVAINGLEPNVMMIEGGQATVQL